MNRSHLHLESSREKIELYFLWYSRDKSLRKQSSKILEKMIDERRVLRDKRDKFYAGYKKELTERKSPRKLEYTLPRILVNR